MVRIHTLIIVTLVVTTVCHAGMVNGPGEEATWIYNSVNGNLKLRSEKGNKFNGIQLDAQLNHFRTRKGDADYTTRFLLSARPGFGDPFGGILSNRKISFLLFDNDPSLSCGDCLHGTTDFGNIMVSGIPPIDIFNNWTTINSIHPSGGYNSTNVTEMTKFGVVIVPESFPIVWLVICCGLGRVVRSPRKCLP